MPEIPASVCFTVPGKATSIPGGVHATKESWRLYTQRWRKAHPDNVRRIQKRTKEPEAPLKRLML